MITLPIEKKPFVSYTLDEDRKTDKSIVISLRLNEEEQKIVETTKDIFNIKNDSKAIKLLMKWAYFVIHGKSIVEIFRYLFKKDRAKKFDFEGLEV